MSEGRPNAYTAQQFIEAIRGSAGIISTIAARVGCDWHTAKKYVTTMPSVKQAWDDECERVIDLAESELIKAIQAGDFQAVKWYLATKGKRRGYVERQEVSSPEDAPLVIRIVDVRADG